jgi:nucleotide-binding universal stress UspA family protein
MKLIQKILVGTDFGYSAQKAVQQAIHISKQFDSSVTLVHVIPEMNVSELNEAMVREAVSKAMQTVEEQFTNEGIKVDSLIEKGVPFIELMKLADLHDVNVMMVGSSNDLNKQLGSTAEKLINKSPKPVWIIPQEAETQIGKILCPTDFSDAASRALENAIHLSRQYDLELTVLHILENHPFYELERRLGLTTKAVSDLENRQKEFDSYLNKFDFYKVRWKKMLVEGSASEEIIRKVRSQNMDLILMGSVGQTAHPKMLNGKTARMVFRTMPTAMISFKSANIIALKLENELKEIEARFKQGLELLENGFVKESIVQFEYCLNEDSLYAPAWEHMADAHYRLGEEKKALEFKKKASEIREKLWSQRVEAEIRNRHTLYKSKNKAG